MAKKILITILTPVYNREKCIKRAIDCVKNLIIPEEIEYEHIIIDDGSTDNTLKVINENMNFKIRLLKLKKNSGVNIARNTGIRVAKGDYILSYDSDDELFNDALIKINKALNDTNKKFLTYRFLTLNHRTKKVMGTAKKYYSKISYRQRLSGTFLQGEFVTLVKKEVFEKMMFNENLFAFEVIFWNKVSREFESEVAIPEKIRIYHDDADNRLCKQLIDQKYAKKRVSDYKFYLDEFEKDYKKFGLCKQLAKINQTLGFFLVLSGSRKESREYFLKSSNFQSLISFFLTYLGVWPFRLYVRMLKHFV